MFNAKQKRIEQLESDLSKAHSKAVYLETQLAESVEAEREARAVLAKAVSESSDAVKTSGKLVGAVEQLAQAAVTNSQTSTDAGAKIAQAISSLGVAVTKLAK